MSVSEDGDDDALRDLRAELEATKKGLDLATKELELVKKADVYSLGNCSSGTNDHINRVRETFPDPFAKPFHSIIIFGAEGNLSMKKTFPALFALMQQRHFLSDVAIIGFARKKISTDEFRKLVFRSIYNVTHPQHERMAFLSTITYIDGQFDDLSSFECLLDHVLEREKMQEDDYVASYESDSKASLPYAFSFLHTRTFYMAVPPFLYAKIARCCHLSGLRRSSSTKCASTGSAADRFILEKPFGKDTESCIALCASINDVLREEQVYRIDHYLGKELVMNVLVMRFANISFNAIWNRAHIQSVQVLCKESIGTAGRGGYFDEYGIIRDVMQNHLLQILALVGMEQPLSLAAEHIRMEKIKLLQAVQPLETQNVLVGQYVAACGQPGYLDDPTVTNKDTVTETYAAAVLYINNPRWDGVPFILKAGKALDESKVSYVIHLKPFFHVPH